MFAVIRACDNPIWLIVVADLFFIRLSHVGHTNFFLFNSTESRGWCEKMKIVDCHCAENYIKICEIPMKRYEWKKIINFTLAKTKVVKKSDGKNVFINDTA